MTEPLVFLPPMLCDMRVFRAQMQAFGAERPVTFAPVHGAERIEEIASDLIAALPARFALVGAGFGGMVALELLRRVPDRLARLALIATSPLPVTPLEASEREPMIIAARMGRMDDVLALELPKRALAPSERRAEILDLVRDMAHGLGAEAYMAQGRALQRRRNQLPVLQKMRQPLMIVGGAEDGTYPVKRQDFLKEMVPDARLEIVAGAGHLPTLEQPRYMVDLLRAWLRQPMILR